MRRTIYISLLCLLFFTAANGQETTASATDSTSSDDAVVDTSLYFNNLTLSADSVESWKNQKAFAYAKDLDSLLKARQKAMEKRSEVSPPSWLDKFLSSGYIRVILWALAIAFVLFVLYSLFLSDGVFKRSSRSNAGLAPLVEEEIITPETDLDHLISQSVQAGNYRQAVRYQYLRTLHKLADKNLVELAKDKTNYQYVHEIQSQVIRNEFATLTLSYEYVWYGEFMIDAVLYKKLESGFSDLNQKI